MILPNSLLVGLAPPLRRELGRPVVCTLPGEDLFLEGLPAPYKKEAKALIARHAPSVVALRRDERLLRGLHGGLPRAAAPERSPRCRSASASTGFEPARARPAPSADGPSRSATSPGSPPRRACTCWPRPTPACGASSGCRASRLEAAGYLAPEHRTYLDGVTKALAAVGLDGEFHYHETIDRPRKIAFLQGLDVLSVPSPYAEPKGLYLLEALANGVPVVQPRHGAFPEMLENERAAACCSSRATCATWPTRCSSSGPDPDAARELGRRGAEGVRAHYSAARMAERTLEISRRAPRGRVSRGA